MSSVTVLCHGDLLLAGLPRAFSCWRAQDWLLFTYFWEGCACSTITRLFGLAKAWSTIFVATSIAIFNASPYLFTADSKSAILCTALLPTQWGSRRSR